MKKKFKKVVKWEGEYDYVMVFSVLLFINILFSFVNFILSSYPELIIIERIKFIFVFYLLVNILIPLLFIILTRERKVYWEEVKE